MADKHGRKPLFKTFYLEGGTLDYSFESACADYAGQEYIFSSVGGQVITNIPVDELRAIARMVGRKMPEYSTSKTMYDE